MPSDKIFPAQPRPEDMFDSRVMFTDWGMRRKILAKATGGEHATVIVRAIRGTVWMSIVPPFTWEAIMEPEKIDEMIYVLGLAREEAKRSRPAASGGSGGTRGAAQAL